MEQSSEASLGFDYLTKTAFQLRDAALRCDDSESVLADGAERLDESR